MRSRVEFKRKRKKPRLVMEFMARLSLAEEMGNCIFLLGISGRRVSQKIFFHAEFLGVFGWEK